MKRFFIFLVILILLSACAKAQTEQAPSTLQQVSEDESGNIVFSVDKIKDLGEYENTAENYSRYYDEFVGEFIPSDDYGEIIPFIGGTASAADGYYRESRIGFITRNGEIVCDPVYSLVTCDSSKNYIYYFVRLTGLSDLVYEDKYASSNSAKGLIIRNDGKVALEVKGASYETAYIGENSINVYDRDIKKYLYYNEDLEQVPNNLNENASREEASYRCPGCNKLISDDGDFAYNPFRSQGKYETAFLHKNCNKKSAVYSIDGKLLFELPLYERVYLSGADEEYIWGQYMDSVEYDLNAYVTYIYDRNTEELHTIDGYSVWRRVDKTKFYLSKFELETGNYTYFIYDLSTKTIKPCTAGLYAHNVMCYVENGISYCLDENYNEIIRIRIGAD